LNLLAVRDANDSKGDAMNKREGLLWGAGALAVAVVFFGGGKAVTLAAANGAAKNAKSFSGLVVYTDDKSPKNNYIPSGWMGDHAGLKMDLASTERPHDGATAIKFTFKSSSANAVRWAGVFWQDPPNNWGEKNGGFDLTGAGKLTFWARGAKGGEVIKEFKVGGIKGNYADSDEITMGPVTLDKTWKQYAIGLKERDLTAISGGFCWATDLDSNPDGLTFYLDDIRFE